jgi:hypothetical protein
MTPNDYWVKHTVQRGLDTVLPLLPIIEGKGFIGGSYAAFMASENITPILPNDIDVFAVSDDSARAIVDSLLEWPGVIYAQTSEIAYTLFDGPQCNGMDIQVIRPHPDWKVFPDDIINSFDMDICRAILTGPDTVLADVNVGRRQGKILRVSNPLKTLLRIEKYAARGVDFPTAELVKVFDAWMALSDERRQTIRAQALGSTVFTPEHVAETGDFEDYGFWIDDDEYFEGE